MSSAVDPDRIFFEDPETIRLKHEEAMLLDQLRLATGETTSMAMLPLEPSAHWHESAVQIHARLLEVSGELSRLNSRRTSRQLSRFLQGVEGSDEMTDAMRRWWMNRY